MFALRKNLQPFRNGCSHGLRSFPFHVGRGIRSRPGKLPAKDTIFAKNGNWKTSEPPEETFLGKQPIKTAPKDTTFSKNGNWQTSEPSKKAFLVKQPIKTAPTEEPAGYVPREATLVDSKVYRKVEYLRVRLGREVLSYHPLWLRDACPCPRCVDKSTTQKTFQSTDLPSNVKFRTIGQIPGGGIKITWENDLPQPDGAGWHVSVYSNEFFESRPATSSYWSEDRIKTWRASLEMLEIPYQNFMEGDQDLYRALLRLSSHGIMMIKGTPASEDSVELIAKRIGNLRDTLYGRTWDVKSIPEAKNVAYTSTHLGLHMDLLYMKDPPGLQFLHCLENTCKGGTALFSDSFHSARALTSEDAKRLSKHNTAFHYRNNNEFYYHEHKILDMEPYPTPLKGPKPKMKSYGRLRYVNWSPPFQANFAIPPQLQEQDAYTRLLGSLKHMAKVMEKEDNVFRYNYEKGDCVIFNNRRVVHGREAFETEGGERWLRGAYVDTDVFLSRLRVLEARFGGTDWFHRPRVIAKEKGIPY